MRIGYLLFSLIVFPLVFSFFSINAWAASPPTGFQTLNLLDDELNNPTGLGIAPDGRIFILEQAGRIRIYKDGVLLAQDFDELPALASWDRGLLGIAFDPDFNSNHFVYFHYVGLDTYHRIVRYDASSDVATAAPVEIYKIEQVQNPNHAGGSIDFGPDGKLYLALGDSGNSDNAQNLASPFGKILRLNKDGTIPVDNPFVGQSGTLGEIWALGLRNPFRFQFNKANGDLIEGDVGETKWEEVNKIVKGGNYGWPICEGSCNQAGKIDPLYSYFHDGGSSYSITGGLIYNGDSFPVQYKGRYFFGDYPNLFIKTLGFDGNGNMSDIADFDPQAGTVVDMKEAADGSIYYVTIFPGSFKRIVYNNGNQYPIVKISADKTEGGAPLTVNFSSQGTMDPESQALSYKWEFGDGTNSIEPNPTKQFSNLGRFEVRLTISDGVHEVRSAPIIIQVGTPPSLNISSPQNNALYKAGDTITYAAGGVDAQGNNLADSAFTTEVLFHHLTHTHPFIRPSISRTGSFEVPRLGETSADVWYEVIVSVKDNNGLITKKSVNIYPQKSKLSITTNPNNLQVSLGGIPLNTPSTIESVVGFQRELDAITQNVDDKRYEFESWSNGGAKKQTIIVPENDTSYVANFRQAQSFNAEYFNNINLQGTPALVRKDPDINFEWGVGSPGNGIGNDNFSVRWTKSDIFLAGNYKFTTITDDGVRLFIDNQLVIDKWQEQGSIPYSVSLDLSAGQHEIRMEYFDKSGGATAKLIEEFAPNPGTTPTPNPTVAPTPVATATPNPTVVPTASPTPIPTTSFNVEYFNNFNLDGEPVKKETSNEINIDVGMGNPTQGVSADNFSIRWVKSQLFEGGTYTFRVTTDDGMRIFLDGKLVFDKWFDQPPTNYTFDIPIAEGNHELKVESYENTGLYVAKMSYQKKNGYQTRVWNYTDDIPPQIPQRSADLESTENVINYDWGMGSPANGIGVDHFVAVWNQDMNFDRGNYLFKVAADDGVRVYIDNQLIIDKWIDQPLTEYNFVQALDQGKHNIRIEYYENTGIAAIKFNFEKLADLTSFNVSYFNNINLEGSPVIERNEQIINNYWGLNSPIEGINPDNFSVKFIKSQNFEEGNYQFEIRADDGVRFWINDHLIIDDFTDHSEKIYKPIVHLDKGNHNLKLEFYERGGYATVVLK